MMNMDPIVFVSEKAVTSIQLASDYLNSTFDNYKVHSLETLQNMSKEAHGFCEKAKEIYELYNPLWDEFNEKQKIWEMALDMFVSIRISGAYSSNDYSPAYDIGRIKIGKDALMYMIKHKLAGSKVYYRRESLNNRLGGLKFYISNLEKYKWDLERGRETNIELPIEKNRIIRGIKQGLKKILY